jgi:hypothetical protein
MARTFVKDPDAVLDFRWDWRALTNGTGSSDWLADGETISSYTVTVPSGITLDSDSEADGAVTAWLSGGVAGEDYDVTCSIVTSAGREDDRTITIRVKER